MTLTKTQKRNQGTSALRVCVVVLLLHQAIGFAQSCPEVFLFVYYTR